MRAITTLIRQSPLLFAGAALSGLVSAVLSLAVLRAITAEINARGGAPGGAMTYVMLAVAAVLSGVLAGLSANRLSMGAIRDLSRNLVDEIAGSALEGLEGSGKTRVITALTSDIPLVVEALPAFVQLLRHGAFVICCFVYLGTLSAGLLLTTLAVVMVTVGAYRMLQRRGLALMIRLGAVRDNLMHSFRDLADGIKQVKLSPGLHEHLRRHVHARTAESFVLDNTSSAFFIAGTHLSLVAFYAVIGVVLFWPWQSTPPREVATAYGLCLLIMLGPLQAIVVLAESFSRAQVALDRLQELQRNLRARKELDPVDPQGEGSVSAGAGAVQPAGEVVLELCSIAHQYDTSDRDRFDLGPIDLTVGSGDLLFIVGGNGSGKTTLAKILLGLYEPIRGELRINGIPIHESNRSWYRQQFCAVFSDFCLFESLAGVMDLSRQGRLREMLTKLRLDRVIAPNSDPLQLSAHFSTGERRRVALLLACLEDRPVCVFDEFAADQDPQSREHFYRILLPELTSQGKLVIVITHDARYFELATCILRLERGQRAIVERPPNCQRPQLDSMRAVL